MHKRGPGRPKRDNNAKASVDKELSKKLKVEQKDTSVNAHDDDDDDGDYQDDMSHSDRSDSRSTLISFSLRLNHLDFDNAGDMNFRETSSSMSKFKIVNNDWFS